MYKDLIILNEQMSYETLADTTISFKEFISTVEEKALRENPTSPTLYTSLLQQFEDSPERKEEILLREAPHHDALLELVYSCLVPALSDEEDTLLAIGTPCASACFYSTTAFANLLQEYKHYAGSQLTGAKKDQTRLRFLEHLYELLFEKYYHASGFFNNELVFSYIEEKTQLLKYFKLVLDPRFIRVEAKGDLPQINIDDLLGLDYNNSFLEMLTCYLPLELFEFTGFTVITAVDVTSQQSLLTIRNMTINQQGAPEQYIYETTLHAMKALVGDSRISFGLLPFTKVNDSLVFMYKNYVYSLLLNAANEQKISEEEFTAGIKEYCKNPRVIFLRRHHFQQRGDNLLIRLLRGTKYNSFGFVPLYHNGQLIGVVEAYSEHENLVNTSLSPCLDNVLPLLAQLLYNRLQKFQYKLKNFIKEEFTSVQPSIQWKFNEVAWSFYKNGKHWIEPITFEKIHPLYGAVDIRNSTVERNHALREDLRVQFSVLIDTLQQLKETSHLSLIEEKISTAKRWLRVISEFISSNEEIDIDLFLSNEIEGLFTYLKNNYPATHTILNRYYKALHEEEAAMKNRKALEHSINKINATAHVCIEELKHELQRIYPCYFEFFRSDGVEHNIYIGQSITPTIRYDNVYLQNARLCQLQSMAAVAKQTHALVSDMQTPLQTTQLIFIHDSTIDISFRKEERRFDVEGSFNVRYEIIKKRIDKACIRESNERLTQPGKIAIVYCRNQDADEYLQYIRYLQEKNILNNQLELLEIEELQGISGLRALRVGVNLI